MTDKTRPNIELETETFNIKTRPFTTSTIAKKKTRPSIALDTETYKALKHLGVEIGRTNQSMLEEAVRDFLKKWEGA